MHTRDSPSLRLLVLAETRPDVQHALFLLWHAANRICAKRLMPFLPTLLESLARHGLSTTRAGTLLKQQIPIRTFEQWKETRPGFLEADLVAHCGTDIEGGYLYTLTLTDVATGWTECLPLLYRSQEGVMAALRRARTLFPFPMRGIDTDNGGEFINVVLITYCEQEHLSFTRGRPYLKNDQCFVEQKISPCKSVPFSEACGKYEPTSWKRSRSNGKIR